MSKKTNNQFKLLPIAAAIMLAFGNAYADEVQDLTTPENSVNVGIGASNGGKDAMRFSQYTGLNQNASLLLDFEINKRDDETGTWMIFNGRNLGLDTRELSYSRSKQGDWKYVLDYNEIIRRDPYIINTGMTGVGSTTPTINLIGTPVMPGAWGAVKANLAGANTLLSPNSFAVSNGVLGSDVELKLKRTALGVNGEKWITPELQFEMSFKNEDKKGARLFGRVAINSGDLQFVPTIGTSANLNGNWAVLLTPEPVNATTRMLEGKLNFARDNLAVTAGYYGSFYINHNEALTPTLNGTALNRGPLWNGIAVGGTDSVLSQINSSVALPPDNQAHQLYVSGNHAFSESTRSNFKLAYTHATQNQAFAGIGLMPTNSALTSLNGVVDTTLVQFGLSMRPLKELSVNANFRYEDRADKTPLSIYNYGTTLVARGAPYYALNQTTNWNSGSQTRTSAKLDGVYRLPSGYSVMLGGDWERKATPLPPANTAIVQNQMFFRNLLNEYGVHGEVRKAMSENLNGALGIEYKQRRGNEWWTTNPIVGNPLTTTVAGALVSSANQVLPDMYMDRNRTKLRGNLDWEATEKLSLQAVAEHSKDDYLRQPVTLPVQVIPTIPGARTITSDSLSLDGTYMVSEDWKVNAFGTRSNNRWNVNKANLGDDTRNTTDTLGVGVSGKATSRLTIGMDILATRDKTTFKNVVATAVAGAAPGDIIGWNGQTLPGNYLPNINYTTNKLNLHAKYDVDKVSDVKVVFVAQQFKTDDWQWSYNGVPFLYSDNTTVSQPTNQLLKFVGASYTLKF